MRADYGMFAGVFLIRLGLPAIPHAVLARARHVRLARMIDRSGLDAPRTRMGVID